MPRLRLNMHINDALFAMSEGNPGAITVLMDSVKRNGEIDPVNAHGPWGLMVNLDYLEIYGSRIWMLYKDVCGEDLPRTTAAIRSVQLGFIPKETLDAAIDGNGTIDLEDLIAKVKEEMPEFNLA
jgi:hypothetical protein